ncbi:MAG: hypothetical protein U0235_02810 [Polyangiaceae bacterium]
MVAFRAGLFGFAIFVAASARPPPAPHRRCVARRLHPYLIGDPASSAGIGIGIVALLVLAVRMGA